MNVPHLVIGVSTALIIVGLVTNFPSAFADTSTIKILPKYIAVYQGNRTHDGFTYFENKTNGIWDTENKTGLITNVSNELDIPVGNYSNTNYVMSILFESDKIKKSDGWDTITINSIQLNAFIDYDENYTADGKSFVTAQYCFTDPRFKPLEKALEKNSNEDFKATPIPEAFYSDVCFPLDSVVVEKNELPKIYSWDLTTATDLINKTDPTLEFDIYAFPIAEQRQLNSADFRGGVVNFFSYKGVKYSGIGSSAVPSITLTYTTEPTFLGYVRDLILKQPGDLVAVFSIIIPAIVWFYRKEIKRKMKGSQKNSN